MSKAEEYAAWLERYADDLPMIWTAHDQKILDIAAELRRLDAENESLKKDKSRYEWLKKRAGLRIGERAVYLPMSGKINPKERKETDAAIDAAIDQESRK